MGTRWYQSLSLRLLLLFWALFFAVASSSYVLGLWFSKPAEPTPVSEDVYNSLTPLLSDVSTFRSLSPGRLLAGSYRVAAMVSPSGPERLQMDASLASRHQRKLISQLEAESAQQLPVANFMLLGPFRVGETSILLTRPLNEAERLEQVLSERQAQQAQTLALLLGSGFIAILLGVWLVRPLRRLTNAMRDIAHGSDAPNLKRLPQRSDELGELARAVRTTAHDLAVSRDAQRRLLSDVSHELRSPLARMQVALMLSHDDDEQVNNPHVAQLNRDLDRLGAIIERILSLSRLENGLVELSTIELDTREVAEQLVADLTYVDPTHGSRVKVLPEAPEHGDWPVIESDPELLRLVLENLVRNALQYSSGPVEISCHRDEQEYIISIRDHGDGVKQEQLDKLFTPFFRADPSRHHKAGVGLGLALSLRAAKVLGGSVEARNHPDGGLEVCVKLPAQTAID
ncbi:HAMP domain-containing sensor histidine kinase [Pseudidiomarina sp.]|uniref:sensor histidine kinase n=1 Tax=Pseudidiomarina sp. TaxID=2081707 RepID=UPI00299D07B3|nr:HAMP domain-containing sensor histidine kinase [Pseudidiomarina sp.]MDX1706004.1 HAMP domain-containing sensor histidine kinase [Pseudidiomarina sp.]